MALDPYAPCPCGSGKKLKFCKCIEQTQDLETVMRLMQGDQPVAALDRINQLLAKVPNAAWLLALKAELAFGMQEMEMFRETVQRFLKLKPDNPLALIMRSMLTEAEGEPPQTAARYLLQGISESREALPPIVIQAVVHLIDSLQGDAMVGLGGFWIDFLEMLLSNSEGSESSQRPAAIPYLNLICKSSFKLIADPAGSPWKERLAEVTALCSACRYQQGETKLRAILRDFPDQPGPLSLLLRAQQAQVDRDGVIVTARKLADNPTISQAEGDYYRAIALMVENESHGLCTSLSPIYCEVDSENRVHELLDSLKHVKRVPNEQEEQHRNYYAVLVGDEVPARHVYTLWDKDPVSAAEGQDVDPMNCELATILGMIITFGKQTDKPARVLILLKCLPSEMHIIEDLKQRLELGTPVACDQLSHDTLYGEILLRGKMNRGGTEISIDRRGKEVVEDFLNCPLNALGGKTPQQAVAEPNQIGNIRAILLHLEGDQSVVVPPESMREIYARLGIERAASDVAKAGEAISLTSYLDLDRIDVPSLSDEQLSGVMATCMRLGALRVLRAVSLEALKRESMAKTSARLLALRSLTSIESDINKSLEYNKMTEEALVALGHSPGEVIMQRVAMLNALRRTQEIPGVLSEAMRKYPNDPYLLAMLQYAQGRGQAGSQFAGVGSGLGAQPAEAASGLVLPGQSEPQESKSKLWLPGT